MKSLNKPQGPLDPLGGRGEGLSNDGNLVGMDHLFSREPHPSPFLRLMPQSLQVCVTLDIPVKMRRDDIQP